MTTPPTMLSNLTPHTLRDYLGYIIPALILLVCIVSIYRAHRKVKRVYDDAPHLQALARFHAKSHESDNRSF